MEDFLHGRYREVDETTPLLLVAPLGPSKEKLMDTLGSAKRIYAPTIVLTDDPDPAIARLAAHVVKMPGGVDEFLTPLLYITPLWLYAHRMGLLRGGDPAFHATRPESIRPISPPRQVPPLCGGCALNRACGRSLS